MLVYSTSELLLSEVKLLLDRSMLDNNKFQPNLDFHPVNASVNKIVEILTEQALMQ